MNFDRINTTLSEYLSKFDKRERTIVSIGIPIVLVIIYIAVVYLPIKLASFNYQSKLKNLRESSQSLSNKLSRINTLQWEIALASSKLKNTNVAKFISNEATNNGIKLKDVKVSPGISYDGIASRRVEVSFKETPLDSIALMIYKVENSKYCIKATDIEISDKDEDGLVSGRVVFASFSRGLR